MTGTIVDNTILQIREVMGVLINWMWNPSLRMCVSHHHVVHFRYLTISSVSYT